MNSLSARLSAIWRGLLRSFRDFPVEAFISVSAFVLTLLSNEKVVIVSNEKVIETSFPLVYFFPLLVLSFCLHRISDRKGTLVWKVRSSCCSQPVAGRTMNNTQRQSSTAW